MVDRELLLNIAGSEYARRIFKVVLEATKSPRGYIYYNELCRVLGYSKSTVNRYLYLMEKAGILKYKLMRIDVSEAYTLGSKEVNRIRRSWVTAWSVASTNMARMFESLIGTAK